METVQNLGGLQTFRQVHRRGADRRQALLSATATAIAFCPPPDSGQSQRLHARRARHGGMDQATREGGGIRRNSGAAGKTKTGVGTRGAMHRCRAGAGRGTPSPPVRHRRAAAVAAAPTTARSRTGRGCWTSTGGSGAQRALVRPASKAAPASAMLRAPSSRRGEVPGVHQEPVGSGLAADGLEVGGEQRVRTAAGGAGAGYLVEAGERGERRGAGSAPGCGTEKATSGPVIGRVSCFQRFAGMTYRNRRERQNKSNILSGSLPRRPGRRPSSAARLVGGGPSTVGGRSRATRPWCANRDPWLRQSLEREYRASFSRLLDDRCPTRPMRRAVTGYPGRATG